MKTIENYQKAITLLDKAINLGYEAQRKRHQLKIGLTREMYALDKEFYLDKLNQTDKLVEFKKFKTLFSDAFGKSYDGSIGDWYHREKRRWEESRSKIKND